MTMVSGEMEEVQWGGRSEFREGRVESWNEGRARGSIGEEWRGTLSKIQNNQN